MPAPFPETQWSKILALQGAGGDAAARQRELLDGLVTTYWPPVYHYFRALDRRSREDAEDQTQQFFTMLLERGDLQKLSAARGTFRGFLKTAIRHFAIDQHRALQARPRTFPFAEAEARWSQDPATDPERAFDREWIVLVLNQATEELAREMEKEGNLQQYRIFADYCLSDAGDVSYQSLAERYGTNLDAVRNGLRSSRQRLRHILRKRLQQYLGPGEDVEAEMAFILAGQ